MRTHRRYCLLVFIVVLGCKNPGTSLFISPTPNLVVPSQPDVWLAAVTPYDVIGNPGAVDYASLFDHPTVLPRITVLKIYSQTATNAPDSLLKSIIEFTTLHHIKLAVEIPLIHSDASGCQGEGVAVSGYVDAVAKRIDSLGGKLDYASMDEPLDFFFTVSGNGNLKDCPFTTVQSMADNIGDSVEILRSYFPNIKIGDIENGLDSEQIESDWFDSMEVVLGEPLTFFHDDALINTQHWQDITPGLQALLKQKGIPYGLLITGDNSSSSNETWLSSAASRFRTYRSLGFTQPTEYIYQTWNAFPDHVLPETGASLTNLIKTTLGL